MLGLLNLHKTKRHNPRTKYESKSTEIYNVCA